MAAGRRDVRASPRTSTGAIKVSHSTINVVAAAASVAVGVGARRRRGQRRGRGRPERRALEDERLRRHAQQGHDRQTRRHRSAPRSTSAITATIAAASVADRRRRFVGVAASIGVAIARNFIGWQLDGTPARAEVRAYVRNSTIGAGGNLTHHGHRRRSRSARSCSPARSRSASAAALGLGASRLRRVRREPDPDDRAGGDRRRQHPGRRRHGHHAPTASRLSASDTSTITAFAGAVVDRRRRSRGSARSRSRSASSLAHNEIGNARRGLHRERRDDVDVDGRRASRSTRAEQATINADHDRGLGVAAAVAASSASRSAAPARTRRTSILTKTNAYIADSVLSSAGDVIVTRDGQLHDPRDRPRLLCRDRRRRRSAVGASIGVSLARNLDRLGPELPTTTRPSMVLSTASPSASASSSSPARWPATSTSTRAPRSPAPSTSAQLPDLHGHNEVDAAQRRRLHVGPDHLGLTPSYDYLSSQTLATGLAQGKLVLVTSGLLAGNVYRYIGTALGGSVVLSTQTYSDTTKWTLATGAEGLTPGTKVRIAAGVGAGDVYEFVGATRTRLDRPPARAVQRHVDVEADQPRLRAAPRCRRTSCARASAPPPASLKLTATRHPDDRCARHRPARRRSPPASWASRISGAGVGGRQQDRASASRPTSTGRRPAASPPSSVTMIADDAATITSTAGAASVGARVRRGRGRHLDRDLGRLQRDLQRRRRVRSRTRATA